jgi:hypothetical protein
MCVHYALAMPGRVAGSFRKETETNNIKIHYTELSLSHVCPSVCNDYSKQIIMKF